MTVHTNEHTVFTENFISKLQSIDNAETEGEEDEKARALLDDFGTHFSETVHMGSSLTIEKTFTEDLIKRYEEEESENCKEKSGTKFNRS